ncbi:MAG: class I SAM-dependent methyltransferase [Verrucomicrobiota bacterium JB022]|nr:class I SAM-dependent methyltransferase [Verrucomicrobiota bacterium JB022]
MPKQHIREYFSNKEVVDHYARATANVGLWVSEEKIFTHIFEKTDRVLELGCGTGRISVGLYELGYDFMIGIDLSREMVKRAQRIATVLGYNIPFHTMDACKLKFDDGFFDGAIFGFNGLMQIPGRDKRRQALAEIRRVIKPGGVFVFTTHDRYSSQFKKFWKEEQTRWDKNQQNRELMEFGDRLEHDGYGMLFVHVPTPEEVREDLKATGWKVDSDALRSTIALEPGHVREFSDECRFWIARNPDDNAAYDEDEADYEEEDDFEETDEALVEDDSDDSETDAAEEPKQ